MDHASFDRIARLLGGAVTRRAGLAAAIAALGAGRLPDLAAGTGAAAAAPGRDRKREERATRPEGPCGDGSGKDNRCRKHKQCCTGYCKKGKKGRTGRCRCLKRGKPCTAKQTCCGKLACIDGTCAAAAPAGIPTGQPCTPADTCAAAAASCREYDDETPAGTYCLLGAGAACADPNQCYSQECAGGVCAAIACTVCASGCPHADLASALATPPADGRIRIAPGRWTGAEKLTQTVQIEACGGAPGVIIEPLANACIGVSGGASIRLKNLEFEFGSVSGAYAMVEASGTSGSAMAVTDIKGCTFRDVSRRSSISSLYLYSFFTVTVTDSKIIGPGIAAETDVDAAPGDPSTLAMTRCSVDVSGFTMNPIAVAEDLDTVLTDCSFTGSSDNYGGFTLAATRPGKQASLTLAGTTTFSGNTGSIGGGGGLVKAVDGGSVTLIMQDSSKLTGNSAPNGSGIAAWLGGSGTATGTATVTGAAARVTGNTGAPSQCARSYDAGATWTQIADCTTF